MALNLGIYREGVKSVDDEKCKIPKALKIQGFDKDGSKKPVKSRLCGQQQAMRQLKLNKFTEQGYRFHQWYPFSVAPHGRHRYKNLWRFFVPIFGKEPDR